jgi:hypothetical protein
VSCRKDRAGTLRENPRGLHPPLKHETRFHDTVGKRVLFFSLALRKKVIASVVCKAIPLARCGDCFAVKRTTQKLPPCLRRIWNAKAPLRCPPPCRWINELSKNNTGIERGDNGHPNGQTDSHGCRPLVCWGIRCRRRTRINFLKLINPARAEKSV